MQTFLPYPDFLMSARVLDRARLGKQRVEVLQLLQATDRESKWRNHPAFKMWRGHRGALVEYGNTIISEWVRRGYKNNIDLSPWGGDEMDNPAWLGDPAFHAAHRSNLLRKLPEHYGKFNWSEPNDLPYIWPSNGIQFFTGREKWNVLNPFS